MIQFDQHLVQMGLFFTSNKFWGKAKLCFMHRQPGYRYEVECDEEALGAQAKHLDISYRSKGKLRFYTPKIKD